MPDHDCQKFGTLWRLFLAINLPSEVKQELSKIKEAMRIQMVYSKVSWVEPENFHVTLHFLVEEKRVLEVILREQLAARSYPEEFFLTLKEVGAFPHKKQPHTLLVSTSLPTQALGLYKRLADVLVGMGLSVDTRPWTPHITLGRVKVQSEVLQPEKIPWSPLSFSVTSFELMKSKLTPAGSLYETLASFPL
ncbi:MAG: 2'-5' RNA ligase [Candidatus Uhrbacteria bacterium GW2011_GWF2_46_218]|uniref:RNA 2',3'-cyclic phosphodiesterase n=1 Tax=Candidatus Uhrbacteria bacterium GW2011_GWF2_46_218 TaxID=1619001 RepID=A0A0G1PHN4_9BACT|nr:MAG: 2'-5' RNA ligase [Candidatus Uhrbacteria bacterium GW2011_GWF2_46_218]